MCQVCKKFAYTSPKYLKICYLLNPYQTIVLLQDDIILIYSINSLNPINHISNRQLIESLV